MSTNKERLIAALQEPLETTLTRYKTHLDGLKEDQVEENRDLYGENVWSNSNSLRKGIAVRYPQRRLSSKISKNETLGKLYGFTINRFSHKNDSVSVSLRMFTPDF